MLRSNALSTGQSVARGLLGTAAGFVLGAAVVYLVGTNHALLWVLLPPAVLLAGLAPAAIGFATGQAAFTLVVLILFNILVPEGWRIGLVRIEDVAVGCAVSLLVGLLFWPRGAAAALGQALAEAYTDSAAYLAAAVRYGSACCGPGVAVEPRPEGARAAAASRRLDDTFRGYLAERGAKPATLAEVSSLVTGVVGLRLAGDAVLDLWRDEGDDGDRESARRELLATSEQVTGWYRGFAESLTGRGPVPAPLARESRPAGERLVGAVARDLLRRRGQRGHGAGHRRWLRRRPIRRAAGPARRARPRGDELTLTGRRARGTARRRSGRRRPAGPRRCRR